MGGIDINDHRSHYLLKDKVQVFDHSIHSSEFTKHLKKSPNNSSWIPEYIMKGCLYSAFFQVYIYILTSAMTSKLSELDSSFKVLMSFYQKLNA